ncbi:hypothetical protein BCV71DRAFT_279323, partial [Rhizopus microsporus]
MEDSKKLPRNAAKPIPLPAKGHYDNAISYVEYTLPIPSPSVYSEIDVVLDDGTLQKRTVSLSTLPEQEEDLFSSQETPLLKDQKKKSYSSIIASEESSTSNEESDVSSDNNNSSHDHHSVIRTKGGYKAIVPHTIDKNNRNTIVAFIKRHSQLTPQQRLVLKCSFAYILGCLFTFVPSLNALIGNNRVSSHLVATATVFFNPAKSLGGMVEAALYGWGYTLFAVAICLGSMLTTDYFHDHDMALIAHILSLGLWLAGATSIIAFLKAHWNKPPVATASSLCFIIIFIIVVREGSANKGEFDTTRIEQITFAVATGTLITVSCCILFWPISASKKLRKDLEATLVSYKVLLKLLTKTFLLDDDLPQFTANKSLQKAIDSHRSSFTSLQKSLQEAKLEVLWNSEIRGCTKEYDAVVKSMQRLAQSVGGLKSSCGLQFEMMKQTGKKENNGWNIKVDRHRRKLQDGFRKERLDDIQSSSRDHDGTLAEFIHRIRQPLKSLAYTCKQTLVHLRIEFSDHPRTGPSNETLKDNLVKAIALFEVAQKQAVERLNRHRRLHHPDGDSSYIPKEDAFLVYFFVFNVIEFARELISLVESVQALSLAKEKKRTVASLIFTWLFKRNRGYLDKENTKVISKSFIPNERHKLDTLHTPIPKTKWRRMVLRIWRTFSLFKLQKFRYAVKATIAATILATPAFLSSTGSWFRQWRMEWALITLMVVMTPTVGGTNLVAVYRIFSTILGCFAAMILYLIFPDKMIPLIICTWLFCIPNFWLILNHKHGKFGQFTLLAYNLVMLNKYNDRDTHQVEVTWLALTRCFSILVGVVFGLFVTAYVSPYEARVELRKGVSDFLLHLAWQYQKLVAVYSRRHSPDASTLQMISIRDQLQQVSIAFLDSELNLQRSLLELQDLLAQTPNEPRLKGAFPVETYKQILSSCQNITDKFASLRTVILKDAWFEEVQHDFIMPVSQERKEMVGNILLYFYILASAMRLKTPLPPYLPPARKAWNTLIIKLRGLP